MVQLDKLFTFKDFDKHPTSSVGYKKIRVSLVYYGKHDGRHKASLVTDGHLTDISFGSFILGLFPSMVYNSLYLLLRSIRWKRGIHILETNTLMKIHLRKFTLSQGLKLLIWKETFSLLPKNYIVSDLLSLYSMKGLLIVLDILYSSCESWNLTSGYFKTEIYMNIFLYMLMT